MKVISPSYSIEKGVNGADILRELEKIGRVCYKSDDKISENSAEKFIAGILKRGHESVIEHAGITVRIICDRGVSHEIVRHRIASYSQESTRYCNYSHDKFGSELTFIRPCFWDENSQQYKIWWETMEFIEAAYFKLLKMGDEPQKARSILPNSLKTEIVVTMNLREWRHFFRLRTNIDAHPQMREIAVPLLSDFKRIAPVIFDDIK